MMQVQNGHAVVCTEGEDNPCQCGSLYEWARPEGWQECEPILAPGARRTVIEGTGLCAHDLADFGGDVFLWQDACFFSDAAITVQAGGSASRFSLTQNAQVFPEDDAPITGIAVTGSDATVSQVDSYGNTGGLHVLPCHHSLVTGDEDSPRCIGPTTTGALLESNVFRYNHGYPAAVVSAFRFSGTDMEATLENNVLLNGNFYGLFLRVFEASGCRLDIRTRNNWIVTNGGPGVSIETRYGGNGNRITWDGDGDVLEGNEGGLEIGGCDVPDVKPCIDNRTNARLTDMVIRGSAYESLGVFGLGFPKDGGLSHDNRARAQLHGLEIDGYVGCYGNDEWGNEAMLAGSAKSILKKSSISTGYVPAQCTQAADPTLEFIDRWLVLGMYQNLGDDNDPPWAPGEDFLLGDWIADGDVALATIMPSEGQELGPPLAGAFDGPGDRPVVTAIDTDAGGTIDLNAHFRDRCMAGGTWGCAAHTLDDFDPTLPPANVLAYLFTFAENLTGAPLPVDLGFASDDSAVVTIRGVAPAGDPEVIAVVNQGRFAFGPGVVQNRVPVTLPEGFSLITLLVAEGGGDWAGRLVLFERGTDQSAEARQLVRYGVTPPP
jgi:hypothetical protein